MIFDIDGTLVDSNDAHAQSWVETFAEAGYDVPFDPNDSTQFDRWLNSVATTVGSDTLFDLGFEPHPNSPGANTLLLKNVYMGNLQASDFVSHPVLTA